MALTAFLRSLRRVLGRSRLARGESHVAGAPAFNALTDAPRVS